MYTSVDDSFNLLQLACSLDKHFNPTTPHVQRLLQKNELQECLCSTSFPFELDLFDNDVSTVALAVLLLSPALFTA